MNHRTVRRSGDRAVGVFGAAAIIVVTAGLLTARPPDRLTADIHAEYVRYLSGPDTITAYLAYPERPTPAPAVIVIHEIFGLSDFIRQTTERLAADGFVAIAPDLLSRRGGTPAAGDSVRRMISSLPQEGVTADLNATFAHLKTLKAVRADAIGVIGFCWGGSQSFRYAANNPDLDGFVVCYGGGPNPADIGKIRARGLGVYAENDARINAGLPELDAALKQAGREYRYTVYGGTGHGFIRTRDNPAAADSAWRAIVTFFRTELGR